MCVQKYRLLFILFVSNCVLFAQNNTSLRGVVHDPQHRPLPGAQVAIEGPAAFGSRTVQSDANGEFQLDGVPEGSYRITVSASGFAAVEQQAAVTAGKTPVLHFQLELAEVHQAVEVSGAASRLNTQTSTVQTAVSPQEILETAGADQTNSLAMITDFTPGAYMVHDMLHMRGGHQVNWFFDGIPVINTNIAANVAPLINPKNVEDLEVERGGYSSEYGDRTYGFFNVVTPSGFERDNQAELIASAGNFHSTDDQFNFGGHTQRLRVLRQRGRQPFRSGPGHAGFAGDPRSGRAARAGFFPCSITPAPTTSSAGSLRCARTIIRFPTTRTSRRPAFAIWTWKATTWPAFIGPTRFSDGVCSTLSPYYHFNSAHYVGGPQDTPFVLDDNNRSNYCRRRAPCCKCRRRRNNAARGRGGLGPARQYFLRAHGKSRRRPSSIRQEIHWANSDALFLEDQYKVASWLTLDLGLRLTHYGGLVNENAADPRAGRGHPHSAICTGSLHGYYAYYYQPPPLDSLAGPSLDFAVAQGYGFIPLPGRARHPARHRSDHPAARMGARRRQFPYQRAQFPGPRRDRRFRAFSFRSPIWARSSAAPKSRCARRGLSHGAVAHCLLQSDRARHRADHRRIAGIRADRQLPAGSRPAQHGDLGAASDAAGRMWATPAYQFGSGFLNGERPGAPAAAFHLRSVHRQALRRDARRFRSMR